MSLIERYQSRYSRCTLALLYCVTRACVTHALILHYSCITTSLHKSDQSNGRLVATHLEALIEPLLVLYSCFTLLHCYKRARTKATGGSWKHTCESLLKTSAAISSVYTGTESAACLLFTRPAVSFLCPHLRAHMRTTPSSSRAE
jgi:hypothetical protein